MQQAEDPKRAVRGDQIDILVDLMGYTTDSRTGVLARRAAPIQVNYFGYSGTMGVDYIDYLIGDQTIIPNNQRQFYSENIVYLPHSFLPPDHKRRTRWRAPRGAQLNGDGDGSQSSHQSRQELIKDLEQSARVEMRLRSMALAYAKGTQRSHGRHRRNSGE